MMPPRPDVAVVCRAAIRENTEAPGRAGKIRVELRYATSDPYAVWFLLGPGARRKEWVAARALVAAGTAYPAGDGDIRIRRHGSALLVRFESPVGRLRLVLPRRPVVRFLRASFRLVRPGCEDVSADIDTAVAAIRAGGWVL